MSPVSDSGWNRTNSVQGVDLVHPYKRGVVLPGGDPETGGGNAESEPGL